MVALDLQSDFVLIIRVILAFLLGGIIGWERESHGISAGIRTYGAISLGACVFGIISGHILGGDPSRVAAQVATGVGFLGGGIIFRQGTYNVTGLTTAATIWATSAIGLAVAFGMYTISLLTSLLIFILLYLPRLKWWKNISHKVSKQIPKD